MLLGRIMRKRPVLLFHIVAGDALPSLLSTWSATSIKEGGTGSSLLFAVDFAVVTRCADGMRTPLVIGFGSSFPSEIFCDLSLGEKPSLRNATTDTFASRIVRNAVRIVVMLGRQSGASGIVVGATVDTVDEFEFSNSVIVTSCATALYQFINERREKRRRSPTEHPVSRTRLHSHNV